jgi:hypothetical protein
MIVAIAGVKGVIRLYFAIEGICEVEFITVRASPRTQKVY